MTSGFEDAKRRRNWLERLGEKIPGFRGFQDRELRREVDKLQREHMAKELTRLKGVARSKAQAFTDAGKLGLLALFERLDRRLDGLAQAVRFSDYAATGFFDVVKIGEAELDALYEFDLSLLEEISQLQGDLGVIPLPKDGDPGPAVEQALSRLATLESKWAGRRHVISDVVKTSS